MKKIKNIFKLKSFIFSGLFIFSFGVALNASAQLVPCGVGEGNANCTLCHLVLGFKNIYDYLLSLLLAATTLVIVVAGVMYMVSSGAKGMIEKAKAAFTYALTAMILGLLAWLIINTVLNALGYNKSGSWWTFTCDTTQTQGPTGGTGGGTLPSAPKPTTPGTPGNCGGMQTSVSNQCALVSGDLQSLLSCMASQGAPGTVNSITSQGVGSDLAASQACCGGHNGTSCPHSNTTCHAGCGMSQEGYSYAVDVATNGWSQDQLCKLASAARQCGSGTNIWGPSNIDCGNGVNIRYQNGHATHLHIAAASCNH